MKICPKCHYEVSKDDKFCINCGYSFKRAANIKFTMILAIMCILFFSYLGLLYYNFKLEQEYMKPYYAETECNDNICTVTANYNRDNHKILANIEVNETIEQWQKEVTPNKTKANLTFFLPLDENTPENSEGDTLNYESKPIALNVGSLLNIEYEIADVKLKDFVTFKNHLQSGFTLDLPMAIDTIKQNRQFAKNEYQAKKARERQAAAARYHMRQLFMNGLISPYTYYGSYY